MLEDKATEDYFAAVHRVDDYRTASRRTHASPWSCLQAFVVQGTSIRDMADSECASNVIDNYDQFYVLAILLDQLSNPLRQWRYSELRGSDGAASSDFNRDTEALVHGSLCVHYHGFQLLDHQASSGRRGHRVVYLHCRR